MTQNQLEQAVFSNIAVWNTSGLGSPNVLPVNHPVFWFWHYAAMVLSPADVLKITLVCVFAAAALGVCALVRRLTALPEWAAWLIGLWAALGPPVFDKLLAGHLYYLISFAAFPWALYALLGPNRSVRAPVAAGVLAALTVIQPQLYVALVVAFVCVAVFHADVRARDAAIAVAISLVLALPTVYLALTVGGVGSGLAAFQTLEIWEYNNSAHPVDALVALGYFTRYAENAYAALPFGRVARDVLYAIPALGLLGLVANVRIGTVRAFALLWALAFCMVAGLYGPLSAPLAAAFARWPVFSVFRELYHFAAPMWLFACILAAFGLLRLPLRWQIAVAAAATFAVVSLWIPAHFAGQLYSWQPDPQAAPAVARLAARPGSDRFLVLPARNPVAPAGARDGGVNPFAYTAGSHPFANEYSPAPQMEIALAYLHDGDPRASAWLNVLGVGACIQVPSLHSVYANAVILPKRWPRILPPARALLSRSPQCPRMLRPSAQAMATNGLQRVRNPLDWKRSPAFILERNFPEIAPVVSERTTDPSAAWVRSYLWSWISPEIAAAGTRAALTWSDEPLRVPSFSDRRPAVNVYALQASLVTDSGIRVSVPSGVTSWVALPPGTRSIRRTGPGIVLVHAFANARLVRTHAVHSAASRDTQAQPLAFDADALTVAGSAAPGDFWVVLKQRFSPFWVARVSGGEADAHVVAAGYANAWHIRCTSACSYRIRYQPQTIARPLIYWSLAAWALAALFSAISLKTRSSVSSLSR